MSPRPAPQSTILLGCDTVVALARAAAGGVTLFGKNSDRPPGEPQAPILIERALHDAASTVRCKYIEVPQVRETARVLGSRPTWLWGLEMGLNEHGVAIGNETIFAHEAPADVGLIGMDLVRLGLERADSAERALEVVIELIERHGQGGSGYRDMSWPYNNSFLIADPQQAWILEAAGRQWATRRCGAVDSISNQVSIGTDWQRLGGTTVARARAGGRPVVEPFDFALAYRDTETVPRALSEGRLRQSRGLLSAGRGRHTLATLRALLRDHDASGRRFVAGATPDQEQFYTLCMHEGPSRTVMSMVAELEPQPPGPRAAWLAFGRPCASVYFPLFLDGVLPDTLTRASEEGAPGQEGLWWVFERLAAAAERSVDCAQAIDDAFGALEQRLVADFAALRAQLATAGAAERERRASTATADVAGQVDTAARSLLATCARIGGG